MKPRSSSKPSRPAAPKAAHKSEKPPRKAAAKPAGKSPVAPRKPRTAAGKNTKAKGPAMRQPKSAVKAATAPMAIAPGRWKWHHQALTTLRDRFIRDCKGRLSDAAQPIEPHSMSMADSATDDFDHDLALTLLASSQDALTEVEAALERIAAGTYGICQETKKPIPAARLRAIPWARFRAEVEAAHEKNGGGKKPRLGGLGSVV